MTATTPAGPLTSIRTATAGDWDMISALLTAAGLPLAGARDHLEGFIIAEREGVIVGCAAVERHGEAGLLRSVTVREAERGTGLGVRLVERAIANAGSLGISTLVLLTTSAERFFPRFGFRVVERSAVPDGVRESAELRDACPSSAIAMRLDIQGAWSRLADSLRS